MSLLNLKSLLAKAFARFAKVKPDELEKRFLDAAAQSDLVEITRCLATGVNVNCRDRQFVTALHIAAEQGNMVLADKLLSHPDICIDLKTLFGNTPLLSASLHVRVDMVRKLLEHGADPNAKDHFIRTSLHIVVYGNSLILASLLIECGAEANAIDSMDNTPLHIAALYKRNLSMVQLLLRYGANPRMEYRQLSLFLECVLACNTTSMLKIICYILNYINNACIHDLDKISKRNALHLVAISGYLPIAAELLERGCDPFTTDIYGKRALDVSIVHGNYEVTYMLQCHMYPSIYLPPKPEE